MKTLSAVLFAEAIAFAGFAILHLGVSLPGMLDEPIRPPAVIVESIAASLLLIGAYALLRQGRWMWRAAVTAQIVPLLGVIWGMIAIQGGRGVNTPINDTFHVVMVVLLGTGVALLISPYGRRRLGPTRPG